MPVKNRKLKLNKKFEPVSTFPEEICGAFLQFNITAIVNDIASKKLIVEKKRIYINKWFKEHFMDSSGIDKDHLPLANLSVPVIQAEIRIEKYEIIDGNHRMQKAFESGRTYIDSYQLKGEQLANYLISKEQYESYVRYWNDKFDDYIRGEL